jgi:hypothetical protein
MLQDAQIVKKLSKFKVLCQCAQCPNTYECGLYEARKSRVGHLCHPCKYRLIDLVDVTQEALADLITYEPTSGTLTHKVDTLRATKGTVATYPHAEGYLQLSIGKKEYLAHRIIWFMMTGRWPNQIDHADHDRSNNRWENLREVIGRDNQKNMSLSVRSSTGITGVRVLPSGLFSAYITVNRKQLTLGSYPKLDQAIEARKAAEIKYGFHPNHGS